MESRDLQTGLELIRKDFNLDAQELNIPEEALSEDMVLKKLRYIVAYLLEKDFSRLLQVLYRIDVSENRLKVALASEDGSEPATVISRMIFEREMQKVATRKKYRS